MQDDGQEKSYDDVMYMEIGWEEEKEGTSNLALQSRPKIFSFHAVMYKKCVPKLHLQTECTYVRVRTFVSRKTKGKEKFFFLQTIRLNLFLACLRFFRKTANQQQN